MANFNFNQDCKVEIWRSVPFTVAAETKEEAETIAASLNNVDLVTDIINNSEVRSKVRAFPDEIEYINGTEWNMFPKENGGECTIEVFSGGVKLSDNAITDKATLMKDALDNFFDARSNYVRLVKERLTEQGGELSVVDCSNNDSCENNNLSLSIIDDNGLNIEVLIIDKVKLGENDTLSYHIKERDYEETDEWVEMSIVGQDEMYILQNILWK